jgi:hypothetical protein
MPAFPLAGASLCISIREKTAAASVGR